MKIDAPFQLNGYACITEDGLCFGESEVECNDCQFRAENECSPVVIEIIPTNEWADRQHHLESSKDNHQAFKEALERLKMDVSGLRKSLEHVSDATKGVTKEVKGIK